MANEQRKSFFSSEMRKSNSLLPRGCGNQKARKLLGFPFVTEKQVHDTHMEGQLVLYHI
jgi:hypothetical protein